MTEKKERPRVYLEEDCPVEEISIESQRERGAMSALPPIYYLHVWWARRPLTVSRAAIIGSLIPPDVSRKDFLAFLGVPRGMNPVATKRLIADAKAGLRPDPGANPYGYSRAFQRLPSGRDKETLTKLLEATWGTSAPVVVDSFAGGGSIPLEASRLGLRAVANDLNPVASVIERATLCYPAREKTELLADLERMSGLFIATVSRQLKPYYHRRQGEEFANAVWVRTIVCTGCTLSIPLSPNWWLDRVNRVAAHVRPPPRGAQRCDVEIGIEQEGWKPDVGTIKGGAATCPRCAAVLDGEEIKRQARSGSFGHQLIAIQFKMSGTSGRRFRAPSIEDVRAADAAAAELEMHRGEWEQSDLIPTEEFPEEATDQRPRLYGMLRWCDFFNPRQLLAHVTALRALRELPWDTIESPERREAIQVYLALAIDKACDYNSVFSRLHSKRLVMVNTFDRHDFAITWSYGEMDGAGSLHEWTVGQVQKAVRELIELTPSAPGHVDVIQGSAASLALDDRSVPLVCIDPPYYDNVMYADLSDFFYVWLKRSVGGLFPELFARDLSEKDHEAVANVARFRQTPRGRARKLADEDYTAKMLAAFREAHRVLRDDGVLTIMFTHKRVDAWNSLGRALVEAGFEITATWPIHTESEHSLHQAKKNAAASTILLVCRKRDASAGSAWWEDIQDEVRAHVRERAEKFASMGLRGQDTSIASFGPALQVISRQWPVKRKDGSVISPDEALDIAREEVMTWMFERIAEGQVKTVDKWTRFYILAWHTFGAREFPYDEARKLALSVKVDIDKELIPHKVLEKKGKNVRLLPPAERAQKGQLDPGKKQYDWDLDYVHGGIHAYENGMGGELAKFHQRTGALARDGYKNAIGYLLDVLPRAKEVTEYHTLDKLWEGNLQDQVKRRKPRTTDPTFEKQQRLDITEAEEMEAEEETDDDTAEDG